MKQDHVGMVVAVLLMAALNALSVAACEVSVGVGIESDSRPSEELPAEPEVTPPSNCKVTTNTTINKWKLKHCDRLSGAPASLVVAGIGLD